MGRYPHLPKVTASKKQSQNLKPVIRYSQQATTLPCPGQTPYCVTPKKKACPGQNHQKVKELKVRSGEECGKEVCMFRLGKKPCKQSGRAVGQNPGKSKWLCYTPEGSHRPTLQENQLYTQEGTLLFQRSPKSRRSSL